MPLKEKLTRLEKDFQDETRKTREALQRLDAFVSNITNFNLDTPKASANVGIASEHVDAADISAKRRRQV